MFSINIHRSRKYGQKIQITMNAYAYERIRTMTPISDSKENIY